MIQNKELYSYIISSIDVMNKSIIVNEQNTVRLFSYIYNSQNNIYNNLDNVTYMCKNVQSNLNKSNQSYKKLKTENDKIIDDLNNRIEKLEKIINEQQNMMVITPVIIEENEYKNNIKYIYNIKHILINVYNKIINLYDKCYKIIFKKQINKMLENEKKLQEQMLQKEKELEKIKTKQRIKEILNTCK